MQKGKFITPHHKVLGEQELSSPVDQSRRRKKTSIPLLIYIEIYIKFITNVTL